MRNYELVFMFAAPKLASQTRSPSTRGQLPLQHSTPFTSQASQSILTTQPSNRKPLPTSSTGDKSLSLKAFKVPHAMSKSKPAELNVNSLSLSKEEVKLSQNASQNLSSLLDNEELCCDSQHDIVYIGNVMFSYNIHISVA